MQRREFMAHSDPCFRSLLCWRRRGKLWGQAPDAAKLSRIAVMSAVSNRSSRTQPPPTNQIGRSTSSTFPPWWPNATAFIMWSFSIRLCFDRARVS